jgi:hypothetical protein
MEVRWVGVVFAKKGDGLPKGDVEGVEGVKRPLPGVMVPPPKNPEVA